MASISSRAQCVNITSTPPGANEWTYSNGTIYRDLGGNSTHAKYHFVWLRFSTMALYINEEKISKCSRILILKHCFVIRAGSHTCATGLCKLKEGTGSIYSLPLAVWIVYEIKLTDVQILLIGWPEQIAVDKSTRMPVGKHLGAWAKWLPLCRRHFKMQFVPKFLTET